MLVTASELELRVREYCDQPDLGDGNRAFISETMITTWVLAGVREMLRHFGRQGVFFNTTRLESNAPGASITISEPKGILGIQAVYAYNGTSRYPLPRVTGVVGPVLSGSSAQYWRPNITLDGTITIDLYPGETANKIETYYLPDVDAQDLLNAGMYFPAGWDEVVVLKAALKAQARDKERHSQLEDLLRDAMLEAEAASAMHTNDAVVRNVDNQYDAQFDRLSWDDLRTMSWWAP